MRKLFFIILIAALLYSCKQSGSKIVVKGEIENAQGLYIYFQELTVKSDGKADSVLLDNSGSFKFKRDAENPSFYTLRLNKGYPITLIVLPGERVKITAKADNLFKTYQLKGSEESQLAQEVTRRLNRTLDSVDSLNNLYRQFQGNSNIANISNVLKMNYRKIAEDQHQFSVNFIEKHPSSLASLMALYQQLDQNTFVLYKDEDLKYFSKTDSILFKEYPKAPYVTMLHANVAEMKEQRRVAQLRKLISAMGAKAPEIALPSPKGDTIRLSSFKGKYVLLDFWASWCKPCRDENPNLVNLYKKYKWKGFEIFQVSLDKSKDAWVNAIRTDGLWWKHASDLKFWQTPMVSLYNFESIPTNFLIDKEGIIIAKNLRGESLQKKLEEIFDKQAANTAGK
jgi:peroxiredoxin